MFVEDILLVLPAGCPLRAAAIIFLGGDIESIVASGGLADVVCGKYDAIDHQLAALGETRALTECLQRWAAGR
ncbi:MAG: hypothetical protein Q7J47_22690 [Azoarcus sp.]|nr:hypothetical protein [Azoarcus sp.]PKO55762.1 MAG: hypothetical protein CVU28_05310 [Betaproteobacteria bacterium HGW-Betaproteobacteria-21]